jgi:long-chain acyl-CoA synthetase
MYSVMQGRISDLRGFKANLAKNAIAKKLANLRSGAITTHCWYDGLVFKKMKKILGGRVRIMVTGSAPINPDILDFLKIAFCAPILEGYGLTESTAASCLTRINDPASGHVGGPIKCVEVKLEDIPDMNYTHDKRDESGELKPTGEICFSGASIIPGYFSMPEKTAETIDADGWLHTGDVGQLMPNGSIKIVDRKKNIFKLSQGEYVAPEKIEGLLNQMPLIAQSFLHGDSLESTTLAIIVPDEEQLQKALGVQQPLKEMCATSYEDIKTKIKEALVAFLREKGCKGFEIPSDIFIHDEPFSVENNILTPTFKLKRNIAAEAFQEQIKEMYSPKPPRV